MKKIRIKPLYYKDTGVDFLSKNTWDYIYKLIMEKYNVGINDITILDIHYNLTNNKIQIILDYNNKVKLFVDFPYQDYIRLERKDKLLKLKKQYEK